MLNTAFFFEVFNLLLVLGLNSFQQFVYFFFLLHILGHKSLVIYDISLLLLLSIDLAKTIIGVAPSVFILGVHQNRKLRLALFDQTLFKCDVHLLIFFGPVDEGVLALLPIVGLFVL